MSGIDPCFLSDLLTPKMNRTKRARRSSTNDRASEDTNASTSSTSNTTTATTRPKRMRKEEAREASTASSDVQPPSPNSQDLLEELFTVVVQHTDEKGAQMSTEFTLLPSRTIYPDYYGVISNPIDLKQIAMKIQAGKYRTLDALVEDLVQMFNNALDYNSPASQIHKDAAMLKRLTLNKKNEFDVRESARTTERTVSEERTRRQTQLASAIYAALEYGEEDGVREGVTEEVDEVADEVMAGDSDDESGQVEPTSEGNNSAAMEELYDAVTKLKGPGGRIICNPFLKLPSKKIYPEYYTVIRSPVALSQIKRKIKKGLYIALDEMILDLQLMCQNAQIFNNEKSSIYRDSERIKNFVEGRLKEFQQEIDKNSSPLRTSLSEKLLPEYDDSSLRKRMKFLLRGILEYKDKGIYPVEMFLEKPLKKDYPDYYNVISQPIDIKTLVNKVQNDKFGTEEVLLADIQLLCDNAKQYNEEGSDIYNDAVKFEEIVKKSLRVIGVSPTEESGSSGSQRRHTSSARKSQKFSTPTSPLQASLIELYEYVCELTDETGRQRSEMFQTLPLKAELPAYYDVIKKPVDLDKIYSRIQQNQYPTMDDIIEDFGQMFENAATFNSPKSQIYNDALVLLDATMEKARNMGIFASEVPNVRQKVQEMLQILMDSLMKFEDANGRNLAELLGDCVDAESECGSEGSVDESTPPLTLENIRSNVYHGRYRRLDRLQDDVFRCLENIRFSAQPDSSTYEDAVALHEHFINKRDELCGAKGEKFVSPAVLYTKRQFQQSTEQERKEAKRRPVSAEPPKTPPPASDSAGTSESKSEGPFVSVGAEQYFVGDFVYVEPYEKLKQPLIVCIEELLMSGDGSGVMLIKGSYMLRPYETFHVASRKFYEKEVFKSDMVETHVPSRIIGKCYVMGAKDYFKMKPVGFDYKDVYVCDARYVTKLKTFRKIKVWKMPENSRVVLVAREKPLTAGRVPSVFAGAGEQDLAQCPDSEVIDIFREPVLAKSASPDPDYTFYEQKDSPLGFLKIGDCVLVKNETTHHIIKIDKIYSKLSQTFVSGTVFIFPKDLEKHSPAKLFYANEVYQKVTEASHPVEELTSRCAVLTLKDFSTCRQTEIPEDQVYIMEAKIQENGQLFKRHRGARFLNVSTTSSSHATEDELYFFDKPVNPKRVVSPFLEAALSGRLVESDTDGQESPPTVQSYDDDVMSATNDTDEISSFATPLSPAASALEAIPKRGRRLGKKSPKKSKYTVSGFILYGAENRKTIKETHPGLSFPEISRVISDMWKKLSAPDRKYWDGEARRKSQFINDELKKRGLTYLEGISFKGLGSKPDLDLVDELEKRILERQSQVKAQAELEAAAAKAVQPPPPPQPAPPPPPEPTPAPSTEPAAPTGPTPIPPQALAIMQAQQQQIQNLIRQQQQIHRPLFLTLPPEPPKVKRALHTEVFLKYLENNGMAGGSRPAVPAWKRQLQATPENTPLPATIPDYWPSLLQIDAATKNKGMELVNKLWNTRNLMFTGMCGLPAMPEVSVSAPPAAMTAAQSMGPPTGGMGVGMGRSALRRAASSRR